MQSFDRSFCGSSFTIFVSTSSSLSCIYLVRECLFHKHFGTLVYHHLYLSIYTVCRKVYEVILFLCSNCFNTHRCCIFFLSLGLWVTYTFHQFLSHLLFGISPFSVLALKQPVFRVYYLSLLSLSFFLLSIFLIFLYQQLISLTRTYSVQNMSRAAATQVLYHFAVNF